MEPQVNGTYTFLAEGIVMVAQFENGELISSKGVIAKVEQIELDHVRITREGVEEYVKLGDRVRWLPEGEQGEGGIMH